MANLQVKDGAGAAKYLKATGAGSDLDPTIPEHKETSATAILAAAQAIQSAAADIKAAVEGTLGVSGTVAVSSAPTTAITASALPLPSGAATSAKQDTAIGHLATIAGVAGDALTDTQLRASAVPVSGTVTASGPLTDTQLRASAVPVTVGAALPAGDNNVGNFDLASAIPAGTNYIGTVGARDGMLEITPTLDTSAYTSGDTLFAATEIANAAGAAGIPVILNTVLVVDKDDQGIALDLHFFDRSVTFGTANSAPGISDADAAYYLGHVSVAAADYKDLGGVKVATVKGIALGPIKPNATSIYVGGVTGGTPTHTASGLVLKFGFMRA